MWQWSGDRFKNAHELLNMRALIFLSLNKTHMFRCMGKIFWMEFQMEHLKLHTKYHTNTEKDIIFIQHWIFRALTFESSYTIWSHSTPHDQSTSRYLNQWCFCQSDPSSNVRGIDMYHFSYSLPIFVWNISILPNSTLRANEVCKFINLYKMELYAKWYMSR